jgi:hypothetical protein
MASLNPSGHDQRNLTMSMVRGLYKKELKLYHGSEVIMKKIILILNTVIFSCCLMFAPSYAQNKDIELVVKGADCLEDNKISIKYGVINYRDFDRPNVSILFKIMEDKNPLACKEVKATIPKKDDGSEKYEAIIEVPCKDKSYSIESTIYHSVPRYKIQEFLSGCQ